MFLLIFITMSRAIAESEIVARGESIPFTHAGKVVGNILLYIVKDVNFSLKKAKGAHMRAFKIHKYRNQLVSIRPYPPCFRL